MRTALLALSLAILLAGCAHWQPAPPPGEAARHPLTPQAEPLERLLTALDLQPEDLRFRDGFFRPAPGRSFTQPGFYSYAANPLEIPYFLALREEGLREEPQALLDRLHGLAADRGLRVFRGAAETEPLEPIAKQLDASDQPLLMGLQAIYQARGETFDGPQLPALIEAARQVPEDVQRAAALILAASAFSVSEFHGMAFDPVRERLDEPTRRALLEGLVRRGAPLPPQATALAWDLEEAPLLAGAQDLAIAVDRAREALADRVTTESFLLDWTTPLGRVLLRAGEPGQAPPPTDTHYLLLIDLDGDDLYHAGAATDGLEFPVSVLIDCAGNDRYQASTDTLASFGAGCFGYGFLVDLDGDDQYLGGHYTQGAGCFGVGLLADYGAGDDLYRAEGFAQGAAAFGAGLLADFGGNDRHEAYLMAQGFGFTGGAGWLLARGDGDDIYLMKNDRLVHPSAQAPRTHNASMGQGFGQGLRRDLADGRSWAGGVGLLWDEAGDDRYQAAVFAQGAAYWLARGILIDSAGNDQYRAHWYAQGAGAHYAVGALVDREGDDRYHCEAHVGQGAAHDFTVAWLLDQAGNDQYEAASLSLAAASTNSLGFLMDLQGDDHYRCHSDRSTPHTGAAARFAKPATLREVLPNAALFLDLAGHDRYENLPHMAQNQLWLAPPEHPTLALPSEKAAGIDGEYKAQSPLRLSPYTQKPPED